MKIEQAVVEMSSSREFFSESEIKLTSEGSFKTVLAQVSDVAALPDKDVRQGQLILMLEKLIARLLELITGKQDASVTDLRVAQKTDRSIKQEREQDRPRQQIEMEWKSELTESIYEQEKTRFTSEGQIKTSDGRVLGFSLDCQMSREFSCERTRTETGKAVLRDPLVINFNGRAADLSGKRLSFDLDADGQNESIPGLGVCSGYLAIDRNADGCINDGSELFGTYSGNGFADLAKLNNDGNQWLDENDTAFESLRVWRQNAAGENTLTSLRDAGIGALYLGSNETPFTVADTENSVLANIRASGIYLTDSGSVGSLQQIDLAVQKA
ncbi:MAG: hypothetical protein WCK63_04445 [Betaproteobacteria bacterium]